MRGAGRTALIVGVIGAGLCVVGVLVDPARLLASYLVAYAAVVALVVGVLLMRMMAPLCGATWFVPYRRAADATAATLPLLALLFLPIAFGLGRLYPWAHPLASLPPALRAAVAPKRAYLNPAAFVVRAAIYLVLWSAVALCLGRWARRRDGATELALARRQRVLSAVALPAVAFALSFAAFDWLMSLAPAWSSTIFGVYYFAGGMIAALAWLALAAGEAPAPTPAQQHALATLLFAFVVFWAYCGFSQFLIIWIGDVPGEVAWYVPRLAGSWGVLGGILLVGGFVLPFLALLFRAVKRERRRLAAVAVWLLALHWLDVYWMVLPASHPAGWPPHWLDLAALAAVGGFTLALAVRLGARHEAPAEPARRAAGERREAS
ncbi:MAG TPA: hypothetical protein VFS40_12985 [Gemmatimonadales bacterium]|nr:hypothetical protein [Gemmatimonadales bacterium]